MSKDQRKTKKRKRGAPCTITEQVRKKFVSFIRLGSYRSPAAESCGVTLRSINRFMTKNGRENRQFRLDVMLAEAEAEVAIVTRLHRCALQGDIRAC